MTVDDLYGIGSRVHIFLHVRINDFALSLALVESFLHDTASYSGHLRTVVRVYDGGNDVTTECRAYLVEQMVVVLAAFLVVVFANLQLGAVGSETTCQ